MNKKHKNITALIVALALGVVFQASAAEPAGENGVININTATASELAFLPGIGISKAQKIVGHRTRRPFKKVEDLMRVKGIGRKTFKKLRPYLTIKGSTTVKSKIVVGR